MFARIKAFLNDDGLFYGLLLLLIGVSSFGLGRWSIDSHTAKFQPATIVVSKSAEIMPDGNVTGEVNASPVATTGQYVASKNSDKYHLPWCSGAKRIKESNKVWFQSKEEASAKGYTPAANCPGL